MLNIKGSLGGQEEARKSFGNGLSLAELVTGVENEPHHKHLTRDGTSEWEMDADEPSRHQSSPTGHPDIWTAGSETPTPVLQKVYLCMIFFPLTKPLILSLSLILSFSLSIEKKSVMKHFPG